SGTVLGVTAPSDDRQLRYIPAPKDGFPVMSFSAALKAGVAPRGGERRASPEAEDARKRQISTSAPEPQARHELEVAHRLARRTRQVGRFSELIGPRDADVGCELTPDLVAHPQSELDVVQAGPDTELRRILQRHARLHPRLQHQVLGEEQVVRRLQAGRDVPVLTDEESGLDVEPTGRETLYSERE